MTRSIKKGFYVEPSLMKKVEKAQSSGDRKPIKKHGLENQQSHQILLD